MLNWVVGITAAVGGIALLVYFDLQSAIPTQEEIKNLNESLPSGCTFHDVGSYGVIDRLIIVECEDRKVTSSYGYMRQQNGKLTEVDLSAAIVID